MLKELKGVDCLRERDKTRKELCEMACTSWTSYAPPTVIRSDDDDDDDDYEAM